MYFPEDVWNEIKRYSLPKHVWNSKWHREFNRSMDELKRLRSRHEYIRQFNEFYKIVNCIRFGNNSTVFIEEILLMTSYESLYGYHFN